MNLSKIKINAKGIGFAMCFSALSLFGCKKENAELALNTVSAEQQVEAPSQTGQPIANQYIVVLKEKLTTDEKSYPMDPALQGIMKANGLPEIKNEEVFNAFESGFIAHISATEAENLRNDPRVAYVEQDQVISLGTLPATTAAISTQVRPWGVRKVGSKSGIGKVAWILDTGVDPYHVDLNVDISRGKSFLTSASGSGWNGSGDQNGHGTHVAGTIAAKDNNYGVVGVAAGATVISVRVLDRNGSGSVSTLIKGLDFVYQYGKAGNVANISIGAPVSTILDNAVKKLASKGIFVAIAAGNSHADAINASPARANATNIFTVSAMDSLNRFASFSNYGSPVDYCVPGVYINSTYPGNKYATMSGTSMAAPHMAGILLITNGHPALYGYVKGDLDTYTDKIASL